MKGKMVVALTICLWSESKLRALCSLWLLHKQNRRQKKERRNKKGSVEEGERTLSTAKNTYFNCLPPSLRAINLFTLWKTGNRKDLLIVFCVPGLFFLRATFIRKLVCHQKEFSALFSPFWWDCPKVTSTILDKGFYKQSVCLNKWGGIWAVKIQVGMVILLAAGVQQGNKSRMTKTWNVIIADAPWYL